MPAEAPDPQRPLLVEPHATKALIYGVASIVGGFACALGFLGGPFAIILGRTSMTAIRKSGGQLRGHNQAQAGFIMGLVATVLLVIYALLVLGVFGPGVVKFNGRFY